MEDRAEGFIIFDVQVGARQDLRVYARMTLSELQGQPWAQGLLAAIVHPQMVVQMDHLPTGQEGEAFRRVFDRAGIPE